MAYRTNHFSLSLPVGPGQGDVPALLRHLAATLENHGQVEVRDIVYHNEADKDGEDWPSVTVYFDDPQAPQK